MQTWSVDLAAQCFPVEIFHITNVLIPTMKQSVVPNFWLEKTTYVVELFVFKCLAKFGSPKLQYEVQLQPRFHGNASMYFFMSFGTITNYDAVVASNNVSLRHFW